MFFPGIQQTQPQNGEEDKYFDKGRQSDFLHNHSPGENENSFNIKNQKQDREKIITDIELKPGDSLCGNSAFIRFKLLWINRSGGNYS